MFFCIAYILHPASVVSTTCKRLQGDVSNSTKTGNAECFENRGHLDAEQPGAAAHGTVSIACSSPFVLRPLLRTWR